MKFYFCASSHWKRQLSDLLLLTIIKAEIAHCLQLYLVMSEVITSYSKCLLSSLCCLGCKILNCFQSVLEDLASPHFFLVLLSLRIIMSWLWSSCRQDLLARTLVSLLSQSRFLQSSSHSNALNFRLESEGLGFLCTSSGYPVLPTSPSWKLSISVCLTCISSLPTTPLM